MKCELLYQETWETLNTGIKKHKWFWDTYLLHANVHCDWVIDLRPHFLHVQNAVWMTLNAVYKEELFVYFLSFENYEKWEIKLGFSIKWTIGSYWCLFI